MTLQQLKYAIAVAEAGSMNEAAKALFLSQPTLSGSIRSLEQEIGVEIFKRNSRGITLTPDGVEFIGYARQVVDQFNLLNDRYVEKTKRKKKFGVSMQHYSFAVKAFIDLVKMYGMDEYEFAVRETRTMEVINDVRDFRSEIGILYMDDFNDRVLTKLLSENNLEFTPLFPCRIYVFCWNHHPLAGRDKIRMEDLAEYPCLSFEQGTDSFFLAEEVLSTYEYKRVIKANDRSTMLNLMVGLNAYTLCCGLICQELNGDQYVSVPLDSDETMTIGYISRKGMGLSQMGQEYIEMLKTYSTQVFSS